MKASIGQRGKSAEKQVEDVLKGWNNKAALAYWRLPDSRSARSLVQAQPGDFCYFCGGKAGIIEVKETQHDFRIAKDKISQLAVLKKFALAGASSVILIHHSTTGLWRALRPDLLDSALPSWDLRLIRTFGSAEDALSSTGYFS